MNIGLDLDNTIIDYDSLFYNIALENRFIPSQLIKSKLSVKNYLHNKRQYDCFTFVQGQVYGEQLERAKLYKGVKTFIKHMIKKNKFFIISHKTKYPIIGKKINLHEKALNFLIQNQIVHKDLIKKNNLFFEPTLENKIKRILNLNIDVFIDDLPDVVFNEKLKGKVKTILIDYNKNNTENPNIKYDWLSIKKELNSYNAK